MGAALLCVVGALLWPTIGASQGLLDDPMTALGELSPIPYCVDPDWPPYEQINGDGFHVGVAADLLSLAASRVGLRLKLIPTKDWDESVRASQDGRCKVLSFLNQTPKRDEWLLFTDPIFVDKNVVVTREEHPFVDDLAALSGKILALPTGTSIEERVRRDYPNLTIVTTASEADAFAMVSRKQADLTIRSLIIAVDAIKKGGWFNLKISGQVPGYENHLRIGVAKNYPRLRDELNRGVSLISIAERAEIANRHVAIRVEAWVDYDLVYKIALLFAVILTTSLFWIIKLRRMNQRLLQLSRTDALTQLPNRAYLMDFLHSEHVRYQRYGGVYSVILIDIDHFKKINDRFGHHIGDEALVSFAAMLKRSVRGQDAAGRWGGEEFLILCPETDAAQAVVLAERLRRETRTYPMPSGQTLTISVGVAAVEPGETIDGVVNRADHALYRAKNNGRDQVRLAGL